jgi:hypothetical protein
VLRVIRLLARSRMIWVTTTWAAARAVVTASRVSRAQVGRAPCVLVVVAGTVCLARRAVRPGGGLARPLALAVLAAAALTLRLTSLWALTEADWLASRTAGLAQVGAALAAAIVLTVVGARDLSRLPARHRPEPPLVF